MGCQPQQTTTDAPQLAPKIGTPFDVIPHLSGGADAYFHGPSTIVAANGDLLVATAQGRRHGIGVIVQSRSTDGGATWSFEGVVYDHAKTSPGGTAYNPAYALAPDGGLVLTVQASNVDDVREGAEREGSRLGGQVMTPGVEYVYTGYVYLISSDHGMNYEYKGFIDPVQPRNVGAVTTNILTRDDTMYLISASYVGGCRLYTSEDNGQTWQLRSQVFPLGVIAPSLWYPTLTFLPEGGLYVLTLARMPDLEERNYTRVSLDDGKTWGPIRRAEGISVRHPVLNWVGETLVLHGRHTPTQDVIVHYSFDHGETWSPRQIIEDYDIDGGYSSSVHVGDQLFVAFSSDARRQPVPSTDPEYQERRICGIRGVFLSP